MVMLDIRLPTDLAAVGNNLTHKVRRVPLGDFRPMPRRVVEAGRGWTLHRYQPLDGVPSRGGPVLLVPPLAAPSSVFDLRRGCSLVEFLLRQGRSVHLVEYDRIRFADRGHGIEHWVDDVLPPVVRRVADDADSAVHVAGWSLGGIFTMFTAAAHPELPWRSATAVASPFDLRAVPLVALARPLDRVVTPMVGPAYRAVGGVPARVARWAFQLSSADKYLTKPLALLMHADDADFLAQLEAVDRVMARMDAYPGRTFGQLFHVMLRSNAFATGTVRLGGRTVRLAAIDVPVLAVAGEQDALAPRDAVRHLLDLTTGAPTTHLVTGPGGHLGVLTGRAAREATWPALETFLTRHD